ncbi:MAG: hypothetical protein F2659_07075 [Actinobacteria bacterium]|jgi:hypothetical protein|uniref:Unannotated protein n=2 Tax=freshwater metagenome TaxID=449393 RepID=A0A6J6PYL5_9ZZZZ|nr:hypothetical protein [Actinomycetota bacterium]MSY77021.1 hypothetical protein [Actinomycetota bacterium]
MAIRLDPSDEYMHELGPESNFNESMYINCFDPTHQVGGWFRIGNRANEGYAEMTVCIYLPDGKVGFMFKRPTITNNDAFNAGGLTWTMVKPFEELRIDYSGKVVVLDDPLQMANPKEAFTNNPYAECEVHITFTGKGKPSMFGGEPDQPHETPGEEFAKGHYEQLVEAHGTIRVGDQEFDIAGCGLRDHSWGPRYWQAPWYYRWLTANFGPDLGFMASRVAKKDGPGTRGGFVWDNGQMHYCDHFELTTEFEGDDTYHQRISGLLKSSRSEREWKFTGEVMDLIPLRNRRQDPEGNWLVTRISEGMTRWTMASGEHDGAVGYGLSEYLDQIIDNKPVGFNE